MTSKKKPETKKVRFTMNAMGYNRFEVYELESSLADTMISSHVAVEIEEPAPIDPVDPIGDEDGV